MPKDNIRDYLDGNELDLSLHNLTSVPVKELAAIPRATHLDLSCNQLTCLPTNFCSQLTHVVKIDLSKNMLSDLPDNFGELIHLQHLDLLGNKLTRLPVSFCQLQKLKWLDLKDNPLEPELKKTAGNCLDERECKSCAQQILIYMKNIETDIERKKKKREAAKKEREMARKRQEEKEREQKKKEKQAEKEKRRQEFEAMKAAKNKPRKEAKPEESHEEPVLTNGYKTDQKKAKSGRSACKTFMFWFLFFVVLLLAVTVGVNYFCEAEKQNVHCKTHWQPAKKTADQYITLYWNPARNLMLTTYNSIRLQLAGVIDSFTDRTSSDSFAKVNKDSDSVK